MAYIRQIWKNNRSGNTALEAQRLNHMEAGIELVSIEVDELKENLDDVDGGTP